MPVPTDQSLQGSPAAATWRTLRTGVPSVTEPVLTITSSSGVSPERISTRMPSSAPTVTWVFLALPSLIDVDVGLAALRLAHEAGRGQGRVLGRRVEDDLGDAVHPRADPVVGVGQVDLGVHGPRGRVFRVGEPGDLALEDLGPEGVERDLGGVADVGQRDVAVGDLGDDADLVGPGDRQQGDGAPLGGRADEGPAEEVPLGDDAVVG